MPCCRNALRTGEVACVSVHGSNRLGTNSLLDINVFGMARVTSAAARQFQEVTLPNWRLAHEEYMASLVCMACGKVMSIDRFE